VVIQKFDNQTLKESEGEGASLEREGEGEGVAFERKCMQGTTRENKEYYGSYWIESRKVLRYVPWHWK